MSWILIQREHARARHIAAACRWWPLVPSSPTSDHCAGRGGASSLGGSWKGEGLRGKRVGLDPQAPPVHAGGQLLPPRLRSVSRFLLFPLGIKGAQGVSAPTQHIVLEEARGLSPHWSRSNPGDSFSVMGWGALLRQLAWGSSVSLAAERMSSRATRPSAPSLLVQLQHRPGRFIQPVPTQEPLPCRDCTPPHTHTPPLALEAPVLALE